MQLFLCAHVHNAHVCKDGWPAEATATSTHYRVPDSWSRSDQEYEEFGGSYNFDYNVDCTKYRTDSKRQLSKPF